MKKNLKRVISAVAALALSTSSFVALAKSFPDVAETAGYAKAVDQMSSMGIIEGYTDGTFDPDRGVTRAEITTMIIRALDLEDSATAMANQNTSYSDVTGNHWAAGYINVATSSARPTFINGMGDGTFSPDTGVTFAQAQAMLMRAAGFEESAQQLGGWPSGYTSLAAQYGVTSGISGVTADTELNRGQVAQMIANTIIDVPIVAEGDLSKDIFGNYVRDSILMNSTDPSSEKFWETIAINKHDTYKVYGYVTATRATNSGLEADEVNFEIIRADRFENEVVTSRTDTIPITNVKVGDTKAINYLNTYAEALIRVTEDEEYELVSFYPNGRTDEFVFKGNQFSYYSDDIMYVYAENGKGSAKTYRLASKLGDSVEWYVNDVNVTDYYSLNDILANFVEGNDVGEIRLVDYKSTGSSVTPDGYYDSVMISYYGDAVVNTVNTTRTVPTVYFHNYDAKLGDSTIDIDVDDTQKSYKFILDGEEISYADLQEYDILSIAWDVTAKDINESTFLNVFVSRDTTTGTVTTTGENANGTGIAYVIDDGNSYELVDALRLGSLTLGTDYVLYLDYFGNVAYYEEGYSNKLYGIIDAVYTEGGGTNMVRLITNDGNVKSYELSNQTTTTYNTVRGYAYSNGSLKPVQDRVVEYYITSAGTLRVDGVASIAYSAGEGDSYKLSTNRIGSVRMSDNSIVLDLTEYAYQDDPDIGGDGSVGLMGSLEDDAEYEAFGYGRANDSTVRFVIITKGTAGINIDSPLGVVAGISTRNTEDGNVAQLSLYTNGEQQYILVDPDYASYDNLGLEIGDVILYNLGSGNKINNIKSVLTLNGSRGYENLVNRAFAAARADDDGEVTGDFAKVLDIDWLEDNIKYKSENSRRGDDAYFDFGPVVDVSGSIVSIANLDDRDNDISYFDTADEYQFASSANIYIYDFGTQRASDRVDVTARGAFMASNTVAIEDTTETGNRDYIKWGEALNGDKADVYDINFALVKLYNDDITEGYVINGD